MWLEWLEAIECSIPCDFLSGEIHSIAFDDSCGTCVHVNAITKTT
jgi:hypothetical protein